MTDTVKDATHTSPADRVTDAMDTARDKATDAARAQAETATEAVTTRTEKEVETGAEAANAAADAFDDGSPQERVADTVATQLSDVAGALRDTDFDAATARVTAFARENPVLFLGGAALLGFAATRFLKASDKTGDSGARLADRNSRNDPWTGHVTGHQAPSPRSGGTGA